jgi:predicted nucleotidyltransferase
MTTLNEIKNFATRIGANFYPDKIILFGSYAEGKATEDSDVDLLVVMPFKGRSAQQAVKIRQTLDSPFPLDLLVRSPRQVKTRLKIGDSFLRDILDRGQVIYEA